MMSKFSSSPIIYASQSDNSGIYLNNSALSMSTRSTRKRKSQASTDTKDDQDGLTGCGSKDESTKQKSKRAKTKQSKPSPDVELDDGIPRNTEMPNDLEYLPAPSGYIKICTWNIASYKASLKKGLMTYLKAENSDIVLLQETKLTDEPEEGLNRDIYPYQYWSHCGSKKGYSGSAVLSKISPLSVTYGVGVDEFDGEGRVITLEFQDWWLIACYIPNAGSKLERLEFKRRYMGTMEKYLRELESSKPIVWAGGVYACPRLAQSSFQ